MTYHAMLYCTMPCYSITYYTILCDAPPQKNTYNHQATRQYNQHLLNPCLKHLRAPSVARPCSLRQVVAPGGCSRGSASPESWRGGTPAGSSAAGGTCAGASQAHVSLRWWSPGCPDILYKMTVLFIHLSALYHTHD